MIIQYFSGTLPFWDDNSLSKPSKSLFTTYFVNGTWTNATDVEVINMDYNSAMLQTNYFAPNNNNTYWRISVDGSTYFYFFTDTIAFENTTSTPVQTINLRLDKWGSCVANLNADFSSWTTQVLATNINLNLYEYWNKVYNNQSSYTWIKNVYPQFQNINLIKYQGSQLILNTTQSYYKINYQVTAYNNTENPQKIEHISGNLKDYNVTYSTSNTSQVNSNLPWSYFNSNEILPFVTFSKVDTIPNVATNISGTNEYVCSTWTIPFLLSFSTDKDIGLIQLPFDLSNLNLTTINEYYVTGNEFINPTNSPYIYSINGNNYYFPAYSDDGQPTIAQITDYFIPPDGVDVYGLFLSSTQTNYCYYGEGYNGGVGWGWNKAIASDNWIEGNLEKFGFDFVLNNVIGIDWVDYTIGLSVLMCPMLFNFYTQNFSYMGQTVTVNNTYCNNVNSLFQTWYSPSPNSTPTTQYPFQIKLSANYPNISLNVYLTDNILTSATTPIGQINLSTALLPNTTNPQATFETNEKKIINNAATLKNLDYTRSVLSYLGGLGITSLMNPLSLFTGAASLGMDIESINLNYSNSFGTAKRFELGHSNQLQTAGDNLGNPDNELVNYVNEKIAY